MFENGVLRVVCGVERGRRTRLHVVRHTSDITWTIRARMMRWAGRVARMGEKRKIKGFGGET